MGQYYKIMNISKKEFLVPWTFNDGAKLLEFGASGRSTMLGLAILLAHGNGRGGGDLHSENPIIGSWAGDRIIVSGDYDDFIDEVEFNKTGKLIFINDSEEVKSKRKKNHKKFEGLRNLYDIAAKDWKDVSIEVIYALIDDGYIKSEYALSLNTGYNDDWPVELKKKLEVEARDAAIRIKQKLSEFAVIESAINDALRGNFIRSDVKRQIAGLLLHVKYGLERNGEVLW